MATARQDTNVATSPFIIWQWVRYFYFIGFFFRGPGHPLSPQTVIAHQAMASYLLKINFITLSYLLCPKPKMGSGRDSNPPQWVSKAAADYIHVPYGIIKLFIISVLRLLK